MRCHYTPIKMPKKKKKLTPPNPGEHVKKQEVSFMLVEMQNGMATLEDSLAVTYKAKQSFNTQSSNCASRYPPN